MRRFCATIACAMLLAACRIEQTPEEYIDHRQTPADEVRASQEELRSRVVSLATAIGRRSGLTIAGALAPHSEVRVIGPADGELLVGVEALTTALYGLAEGRPHTARRVDVTVSPGNSVAWFQAEFAGVGATPEEQESFRFSGVFLRQDGEWRLIQGHLSRPLVEPSPEELDPVAGGTRAAAG